MCISVCFRSGPSPASPSAQTGGECQIHRGERELQITLLMNRPMGLHQPELRETQRERLNHELQQFQNRCVDNFYRDSSEAFHWPSQSSPWNMTQELLHLSINNRTKKTNITCFQIKSIKWKGTGACVRICFCPVIQYYKTFHSLKGWILLNHDASLYVFK